MKKLFLTSFTFTTGDIQYTEYRIVVVSSIDVQKYRQDHKEMNFEYADAESNVVIEKAQAWFSKTHTESIVISIMAHPAIE